MRRREFLQIGVAAVGLALVGRASVPRLGGEVSDQPPLGHFPLTAPPRGGWVLSTNPKAVHHNGTTYFAYTAGDEGNAEIAAYVHADRSVVGPTVLRSALDVDLHGVPAIVVRDSDKRLMAFYSADESTQMYVRISTNREDSTAWGAETDLHASLRGTDYTYPSPKQLTGLPGAPVFLFYRSSTGGSGHDDQTWDYSASTDEGSTWIRGTTWFTEPRRAGYAVPWQTSESRVDVAVYDGDPATEATIGAYHGFFDGTDFHRTDGTNITSSIPLRASDLTEVYRVGEHRCITQSVVLGVDGHPRLAFMVITASGVAHARYARWNGSSWETFKVCDNLESPMGGVSTGGCALYDQDTMYVARHVGLGKQELWRYRTVDGGETWTGRAITADSTVHHSGPTVPFNAADGLRVLFRSGFINTDVDYSVGTSGSAS